MWSPKVCKKCIGALLPNHDYLTIKGFSLIHPFPIFRYKGFSLDTIANLKEMSLTYNEATNVIYMSITTTEDAL